MWFAHICGRQIHKFTRPITKISNSTYALENGERCELFLLDWLGNIEREFAIAILIDPRERMALTRTRAKDGNTVNLSRGTDSAHGATFYANHPQMTSPNVSYFLPLLASLSVNSIVRQPRMSPVYCKLEVTLASNPFCMNVIYG